MSSPLVQQHRVFFALWPDDDCRYEVGLNIPEACRKPVPVANLHLTLAFLGNVSDDELILLQDIGAMIKAECFKLGLQPFGFFKKRSIFWLGTAHLPSALASLVAQLWQQLEKQGWQREPAQFTPHVTLARRCSNSVKATQLIKPIFWHVRRFSLLESVSGKEGVSYQQISSWQLSI
ncbi:MAG: RNA 2',3'-cyclic phosphodiesterase [Gammaproteobacteria bacterium]|nr:RNA 2',3'-cyclic phosphodiesterase [Gammaproteobacteria bacterium]